MAWAGQLTGAKLTGSNCLRTVYRYRHPTQIRGRRYVPPFEALHQAANHSYQKIVWAAPPFASQQRAKVLYTVPSSCSFCRLFFAHRQYCLLHLSINNSRHHHRSPDFFALGCLHARNASRLITIHLVFFNCFHQFLDTARPCRPLRVAVAAFSCLCPKMFSTTMAEGGPATATRSRRRQRPKSQESLVPQPKAKRQRIPLSEQTFVNPDVQPQVIDAPVEKSIPAQPVVDAGVENINPQPRRESHVRIKKSKHAERSAQKGDGSLVLVC